MTLRQLHYTSAPPGPDGSGFRFTSVSDGVGPEVLRLAEPVLGYEPPRDAPLRPAEAELAEFPVAFAHTRLPDGSSLVSRTVYTGVDYTGRYGNFHAHAVHLAPGEFLPHPERPAEQLRPIEVWESPSWRQDAPVGQAPPDLPFLKQGFTFGREVLCRFAAERAEQLAPFLADVRALFADPPGPQLVLVERDPRAVAHWVALATGALPARHAAELTFTTYTRRPYRCGQSIVGIRPDAEFSFGPVELQHHYRVRHGLGGPSSPVAGDPWAELAAAVWLAGRVELFARAAGPEGGFATGRLAALALAAGVPVGAAAARAAAEWACARPTDPAFAGSPGRQDEFWDGLTAGLLAADAVGPDGLRRLAGALHTAGLGARAVAALTATALRAAVLDPSDELAAPALPADPEARRELADSLAPALRARIGDPATDPARLLGLVELAGRLGVDPQAPAGSLAERLTATLTGADPQRADRTRRLLDAPGGAELRAAVLDRLNDLAREDDPAPLAAVVGSRLRFDRAELTDRPHLAAVRRAGRDHAGLSGTRLLTALLNDALSDGTAPSAGAGGDRPEGDPLLLRTVFRLGWPDSPPTVLDAREVLRVCRHPRFPPDLLPRSGLGTGLARAALGAAADDPHAASLAGELLAGFADRGLPPRERAALEALHLAGELRAGRVDRGFTRLALELALRAAPLEAAVATRLTGALAYLLLGGHSGLARGRAPGVAEVLLLDEVGTLARSGDPAALAAYRTRAAGPVLRRDLANDSRYPAACFVAWSSFPDITPGWERTRTDLLDQVLRPTLRALPADARDRIGSLVAATPFRPPGDLAWSTLWADWHRGRGPGLVGRLFGRARPGPPRRGANELTPDQDDRGKR
ncbi:GTPase-associated protein 1-related protein [Kitasatospora sp. NPDC059646]|uniref:GTPase-associated protein 1-related protein n=1 Tax=Kitasatospora sp. NPDC059646 TaxID=3346893 RepID=UPI0036CBA977